MTLTAKDSDDQFSPAASSKQYYRPALQVLPDAAGISFLPRPKYTAELIAERSEPLRRRRIRAFGVLT
jgi:hypothetical protein